MIDIKQFSELQKQSKNSFANQKQLMKKVMAGQTVLCSTCQQPLCLLTPKQGNTSSNASGKSSENSESSGIRCKKGCTDIQLDFV